MPDDTIDELEALRGLAARLIPGAAPWGQFGRPTLLRPAVAAPDLPLDVPLPTGSRLIGSCSSGSYSLTLLDSEQSPQAVLRFYERELDTLGWYRHDTQGPSGFLPPGERATVQVLFCRSSGGPSLHVTATPSPQFGTELRLQTETDPQRTPCARPPGFRPHRTRDPRHISPLPPLVAPPGAIMESFGHVGGGGSYQAVATMQSNLALDQVADHFGRLLQEAGWKEDRAGGSWPVVWSAWSCHDETGEPVGGFLLAFQQDDRRCAVQVDREIAPGARHQAEIESREQARARERAAAEENTSRVETDASAIGEATGPLRELIQRIVAPAHPSSLDYANPELIVGRLPDALPIELPLPPASRVLGSLALGRRTMIYLESETRPQQILAFYRTHLSPPSWTFFGERRGLGGFAAASMPEAIAAQFCPAVTGPAISLGARVRPDGVADAQIEVIIDLDQTPCGNPNSPLTWEYRTQQPQLPILVAPPQSDFADGGGSGSELHWESRGYLYTALDLRTVADFYAHQFVTAGWQERGRGGDEVVRWSRWGSQEDEGVEALYLTVQQADRAGYFLLARASRHEGARSREGSG